MVDASASRSTAATLKRSTESAAKASSKDSTPPSALPIARELAALRARRDAIAAQRVAAAKRVNVLQATDAALVGSLKTLDKHVASQSSLAREARRRQVAADAEVAAGRRRLRAVQVRLVAAADANRRMAVSAYVGETNGFGFLDAKSISDLAAWETYQAIARGFGADKADSLRSLQQDATSEQHEFQRRLQVAQDRRQQTERQLSGLRVARRDRARLVDHAEQRLEQTLAEAAALEGIDKRVAGELQGKQTQLAVELVRLDRIRLQELEAERRRQAAANAAAAARARTTGKTPPATVPFNDQGSALPALPARSGSGQIVTVGSLQVDSSIADRVRRLIATAQGVGITLSGGGYRDSAQQVAMRRAHCGSSTFAVYQMRASECRPPTARPGASMHEQGLAIDFTANGSLITSRGSSAYQWLRANAAAYGLQNLPSEPWHWSTNGN